MTRTHLAALSFIVLAACSRSAKSAPAADEPDARDLNRPAAAADQPLNDRPAAAKPASKPAAAPATKTATKPAAKTTKTVAATSTKPAAPSLRSLAPGTRIRVAMVDSINSRRDKAGKIVSARVASDVKDRAGRVVVPAGSVVKLTVTQLEPAKSKSAKDGKLALRVNSVEVHGRVYALEAEVVGPIEHELKGRGVTAGEVEKVGVGTGIGVLGGAAVGGGKGALIGGAVGAAAGTAVAVQTASRDVVVRPGTKVTIELREKLVASAR